MHKVTCTMLHVICTYMFWAARGNWLTAYISYSISAGAATTPLIKFQNVKEIDRVVVLESFFNSTHLANLLNS